ncbi:MAG: hypothetical protein LBE10_08710 [Treponema sp.]|nr:hypothetical protein [Treponema sp.]
MVSELTDGLNRPFSAAIAMILLVLTLGITYGYSHVPEGRYIKALHLNRDSVWL